MVETMRERYTLPRFLCMVGACALLGVAFLLMLADTPRDEPGRMTPQTVAPAVPFVGAP